MPELRGSDVDTIAGMLAAAVTPDPTRPLLTYYDGASGERTELSGATLDNWVAKTANLVIDGCGLAPGDVAGVDLPPHWQSAAVLLGCLSAGLAVTFRPGSTDVAFVAAGRLDAGWTSADRYVLGLAPMGQPMRQAPAGWADYAAEVRAFGDRFVAAQPVSPGRTALADEGLDQAGACRAARGRAAAADLHPGDRVLLDVDALPNPMDWLFGPLAAGASTVLCRGCDPGARQRIRQQERITR